MADKLGRRLGVLAGVILAVITAVMLVSSSVYHTTEDQYAVITTLGKPSVVEHSGLHFKIPFVQEKTIISKNIHGIEIGYNSNTGETIESESVMITVDYNFVDVDFYVEWKVTDPIKYLYASNDPEGILKMISQSYIRDTIGLYPVDDVITSGKSQIQAEIKEKIMTRMEQEDLGIQLVNLTIQDAEPPTAEVLAAFKDVENAKQGKDTALNNANKYRSEQIPKAEAQADQILRRAEAAKEARINEAAGQVARFNAMYEEYSKFPGITKQRMYYETMEQLLPGIQVILTDENGNHLNMFSFDGAKEGAIQ